MPADEGRPIRTHDIRHSFAIATLEKMVEQGRDACAALPLLSVFMGHANNTFRKQPDYQKSGDQQWTKRYPGIAAKFTC